MRPQWCRHGARESLQRLRTDHFDLYQLHGLAKREDLEKAMGPGGALEAVAEARKEGLIRWIGFSAHSAEVALEAMERFSFDTILFPVNFVTWIKAGFGPQVIAAAEKRGMGCLALKAMALGRMPKGTPHLPEVLGTSRSTIPAWLRWHCHAHSRSRPVPPETYASSDGPERRIAALPAPYEGRAGRA